MEIWKDIADYENLYQISNRGRVKSLPRNGTCKYEKILTPHKDSKGYYNVSLSKNGKRKIAYIHRLVAEAFIPNPENLPDVYHIDGNPANNDVTNLYWCTHQFILDQLRLVGKIKDDRGTKSPNTKLTSDDIIFIRSVYKKGDANLGLTALANQFKVSKSTISYIINNKTYITE